MRNLYMTNIKSDHRTVNFHPNTNLKSAIATARKVMLMQGEEILVTTNEGKLFEAPRVCYSRKYQPFEKKRGKQS